MGFCNEMLTIIPQVKQKRIIVTVTRYEYKSGTSEEEEVVAILKIFIKM